MNLIGLVSSATHEKLRENFISSVNDETSNLVESVKSVIKRLLSPDSILELIIGRFVLGKDTLRIFFIRAKQFTHLS